MAIAALAMSIPALVLSFVPFVCVLGLLMACLGLALSRRARRKVRVSGQGTGRLPSGLGLILSVAALIVSLGQTALGLGQIYMINWMNEPEEDAQQVFALRRLDPRPLLRSLSSPPPPVE